MVSPNAQGQLGRTALFEACVWGDPQVRALLFHCFPILTVMDLHVKNPTLLAGFEVAVGAVEGAYQLYQYVHCVCLNVR